MKMAFDVMPEGGGGSSRGFWDEEAAAVSRQPNRESNQTLNKGAS